MTTQRSRLMRHLVLGAVVLVASAAATPVAADSGLSKAHIRKFEWQCLDATENERMCRCARRKLERLVPASEVRLGHRVQVSIRMLEMTSEGMELLEPEIDECMDRYPKTKSRGRNAVGIRGAGGVPGR